jgi:hypothetical protein
VPVRGCRGLGTWCARTHSGRRRPGFAPRSAYALVNATGIDQEQRSVKPSAQPTLVRTQHLPPQICRSDPVQWAGPGRASSAGGAVWVTVGQGRRASGCRGISSSAPCGRWERLGWVAADIAACGSAAVALRPHEARGLGSSTRITSRADCPDLGRANLSRRNLVCRPTRSRSPARRRRGTRL